MTLGLWLSLIGLALLDTFNVSTIWVVVIILLLARRPVPTAWAFAIGAIITFTAFTLMLYLGANAAEALFTDLTLWMRRILFTVLTLLMIIMGIRRLRTRKRKPFRLPRVLNAWTALPLGLAATIADIPNSFPMFFALERLATHGIQPDTGIPVLLVYCFIQALPTLIVLILGTIYKDRLRDRLAQLLNRFATGEAKASWKIASIYFIAALGSLAVLIFVIG